MITRLRFVRFLAYGLLSIATGFLIFLAFFSCGVFSNIPIVFYRGVLIAALSALTLLSAGLLRIRFLLSYEVQKNGIAHCLLAAGVALSFAFNCTFLIVLPVTIDRSVSIFLLGEIASREGGAITTSELEEAMIRRYVHEYGAVPRRLEEQRYSGNLTREGEHYRLTEQGRNFVALADILTGLFRLDKRLIGTSSRNKQSGYVTSDSGPQVR